MTERTSVWLVLDTNSNQIPTVYDSQESAERAIVNLARELCARNGLTYSEFEGLSIEELILTLEDEFAMNVVFIETPIYVCDDRGWRPMSFHLADKKARGEVIKGNYS